MLSEPAITIQFLSIHLPRQNLRIISRLIRLTEFSVFSEYSYCKRVDERYRFI